MFDLEVFTMQVCLIAPIFVNLDGSSIRKQLSLYDIIRDFSRSKENSFKRKGIFEIADINKKFLELGSQVKHTSSFPSVVSIEVSEIEHD